MSAMAAAVPARPMATRVAMRPQSSRESGIP
jgi:hypothetical protein